MNEQRYLDLTIIVGEIRIINISHLSIESVMSNQVSYSILINTVVSLTLWINNEIWVY